MQPKRLKNRKDTLAYDIAKGLNWLRKLEYPLPYIPI